MEAIQHNVAEHRKVFISFLGTSNYLQTRYNIEGSPSNAVRFVQEALTDHICKEWSGKDRIYVFFTQKSHDFNWVDEGQTMTQEDAALENRGLKSILLSKPFADLVETEEEELLIPEGFSTEEVWQIFDKIYSHLQSGDEVYLDVTHAFRSIPLFSTVLFNYAQFMKDIVINKVFYGAFEKLGIIPEVKQIPVADRLAPVLDLSNLIQLQNLTQVANGFIKYGKISDVGRAFELGDDTRINNLISEFRSVISKLDYYILTNRIKEIEEGKYVRDIKIAIKNLSKKAPITHAQRDILKKLEDHISSFTENGGIKNIIASTNWALQYDMVQQAYTLAEESIISLVLEMIQDKVHSLFEEEVSRRNFVSSLLSIKDRDINKDNFKAELAAVDKDLVRELLDTDLISRLRKPFQTIAKNRNEISHGKNSSLTLENFKNQHIEKFKECMDIIQELRPQ